MPDILSLIQALHRPRLLVRAARFGMEDYSRDRHLTRILNSATVPAPRHSAFRLLALEAECEDLRQAGSAAYSVARHIEVLVALMSEARVLAAGTGASTAASGRSPLQAV